MVRIDINKSRWSHTTPLLWYACAVYTFGDILFGYDTGSFGSLQALPSFLDTFGEPIGKTRALSTQRKSVMNSVVWIGKGIGTLLFEPLVERIGYKYLMYLVAVIQIIAVILEMVAHEWILFSVGRVLAYLAVGFVENAVPSYASELAPVSVRGFFSGSLLFFVLLGNLWGAGMSKAYATETGRIGWMIPVAMQFIPAVCLIVALPFTPESPRWLVSKGRKAKAQKELERVRPMDEVASGLTTREIEALEQAIEEAKVANSASWFDLFRRTYFRRSLIAAWLFILQQITGNQFVVSYGATFYVQFGLGSKSFTYTVLTYAVAIVACGFAMLAYDKIGRRPMLIAGCFLQVLFMCLVAGLGSEKNPGTAAINGVVASIILFYAAVKVSLSSLAYVIGSEIGGTRMRKKVLAWATFWDVVAAFVVTYSIPYLLTNQGVNLGAKVGWIFAGLSAASLVFVIVWVPELKGRSLEETDELFENKLWAWQFSKAETKGVGRRIAQLEEGGKMVELSEEATTGEREVKGGQLHLENTV